MKLSDEISAIRPRQIFTSRGLPTVEVDFILKNTTIRSSVPSGKSTGSKEACVITDDNNTSTVLCVVESIKKHSKEMLNIEIQSPEDFDRYLIDLDGTKDKCVLGANFILPLSMSCYRLFSILSEMSLWKYISHKNSAHSSMPVPHFNVLNGGLHSGNNISCQEIMICFNENDTSFSNENNTHENTSFSNENNSHENTISFSKNLGMAVKFYKCLRERIEKKYGSIYTSVADEGGFAPPISSIEEGLDLIVSSASDASISEYKIALDLAANSFCTKNGEFYVYTFDGKSMDGRSLADYFCTIIEKYPIYILEDPFGEDDFDSWRYLYSKVGKKINIQADDLTVTNPKIIENLYNGMFNSVLIKPNQIGSVSECIEAIKTCKRLGLKTMVSHRSAETEDTFISHLAVGMGSDYIKSGAPCRGERIAKYNELLRIEEEFDQSY